MFDVNLYLEVSGKDRIKRCRRNYHYVLECELKDGRMHTRDGAGCGEVVSAWEIILTAMVEAIGRINRPSKIHLHTECPELCRMKWMDWLQGWKENGFLTARGKPVKNRELWECLGDMMENHLISVEGMEHPEMERKGKDTGTVRQAEDELERARREARSLDPDKWKRPYGLKRIGEPDIKEIRGRKYKYTYYRDDNTENEEFRYRYESELYEEQPEMG